MIRLNGYDSGNIKIGEPAPLESWSIHNKG